MPGDLAAQEVDAVVTILPQNMEYHGILNSRLAEVAGRELPHFIKENIFDPRPGDIFAVPGFGLKAKHILIAIVPVWRTEFDRQDRVLVNICRRAMEEARIMGLRSIAFPPLASGNKGFPKKRAARLILQGIEERLETVFEDGYFDEVRIVARSEETCRIFRDRITQMGG